MRLIYVKKKNQLQLLIVSQYTVWALSSVLNGCLIADVTPALHQHILIFTALNAHGMDINNSVNTIVGFCMAAVVSITIIQYELVGKRGGHLITTCRAYCYHIVIA